MRRRRWATVAVLGLTVLAALAGTAIRTPRRATAQPIAGYRLFGHDNGYSTIIRIDTATGTATEMGPTGFRSGSSGMATALGAVEGPGGARFAKGTFFGILTDGATRDDYVVVVDPTTGAGTKLVQTSRTVSGRGVAFGPDGSTFYLIESTGMLSTVDTVSGAINEIGIVTDAFGGTYSGDNLEWDPDLGAFVSLMTARSGGGGDALVIIDPATAAASAIGSMSGGGLSACTLVRAPNEVPGPGGSTVPAGTWFTINTRDGSLVTLDVDIAAGTVSIGQVIGTLGAASSGQVCGTAFTLPVQPPTPTPEPPTPTPTATVPPADCVCQIVRDRVPTPVIQDALANPARFRGWMELLDPGKPAGPNNPPQACLSLLHINLAYNPAYNYPVWRVGCP